MWGLVTGSNRTESYSHCLQKLIEDNFSIFSHHFPSNSVKLEGNSVFFYKWQSIAHLLSKTKMMIHLFVSVGLVFCLVGFISNIKLFIHKYLSQLPTQHSLRADFVPNTCNCVMKWGYYCIWKNVTAECYLFIWSKETLKAKEINQSALQLNKIHLNAHLFKCILKQIKY